MKKSSGISENINKHPAVIYFSIFIIGFSSAAACVIFIKTVFNLELVQTGTYINKFEMQRQIDSSFIQKEIYTRLQKENDYLKETIYRLKSKENMLLLTQIKKLEIERDELIEQIDNDIARQSPIFIDPTKVKQENISETYRTKTLKEKLSQIMITIAELYKKIQ